MRSDDSKYDRPDESRGDAPLWTSVRRMILAASLLLLPALAAFALWNAKAPDEVEKIEARYIGPVAMLKDSVADENQRLQRLIDLIELSMESENRWSTVTTEQMDVSEILEGTVLDLPGKSGH